MPLHKDDKLERERTYFGTAYFYCKRRTMEGMLAGKRGTEGKEGRERKEGCATGLEVASVSKTSMWRKWSLMGAHYSLCVCAYWFGSDSTESI